MSWWGWLIVAFVAWALLAMSLTLIYGAVAVARHAKTERKPVGVGARRRVGVSHRERWPMV